MVPLRAGGQGVSCARAAAGSSRLKGEIPFGEITDIGTEVERTPSSSGNREVPIYRLTIITPRATIPMAYTNNADEDRYSALRRQILDFVRLSLSG